MVPACPVLSEDVSVHLWFIIPNGPKEKFFFCFIYIYVLVCITINFFPEVLYVSEGRENDNLGCTITYDANLLI